MTTKTQTELGRREEEARRIARAEGFPIIFHEDDWTFFTLDDGQIVNGASVHTHFEWVERSGRFEGYVS